MPRKRSASRSVAFPRLARLLFEIGTEELPPQAAWDGGQPDRARDIIKRALPQAAGETRAQLLHLSGVIEARTGSMREACTKLLQAAEASNEPSRRLEMLAEASEAAAMYGDTARSIRLADSAAGIVPVTPGTIS